MHLVGWFIWIMEICLLIEIINRYVSWYINLVSLQFVWKTGRFILFSVITNICNKKTKGPTLMEIFKATGKLKKFFLTTRNVRYVHRRWHGTHRYDIQVLATHTREHGCIYILHCCNDLCLKLARTRGGVLCVLCTKCTLHSNHRLTRVIFQQTKQILPPERQFSPYILSHRLAAEMWTTINNNLLGKNCLSCSFCLYGFRKYVSSGFPIINFCNPGVHYETSCTGLLESCAVSAGNAWRPRRGEK